MKQFQRMLNTVNFTKKIRYLDGKTFPPPLVDLESFFKQTEKAEVFVFAPKSEDTEEIDFFDKEGNTIYKDFDAPFPVFSIEVIGGEIMVPIAGPGEDSVTVHCLLVCEIAPKVFNVYAFATLDGSDFVFSTRTFDVLVASFTERLNSESVGTEKCSERVVLGSGPTKRKRTIRRVTHVRPKRDQVQLNPMSTRPIDWSNRWFVRGHWRKSQALGKDRSGSYCVQGYTWAVEHVKGPDNQPLLKKTRLVHSVV